VESLASTTLVMHVEGGTWPSGTNLERHIVSFAGSGLKWTDPTPSLGKVENVWKRAE
jgi:hypothetical protein